MLRIPGFLPLLLLAVAALAPAPAAQDASDEKHLLASFHAGFASPDPELRLVALETLAARSRGLSDHGRSRKVAQALGLRLRDFSVRSGLPPVPDDAGNMAHAWEQWLDKHGDRLPRSCPNR